MSEDRERNPATNADTPDGAPKDAERPHSDVGAEATGRDVLIAGITPEELRALVPAETLQHALAASDPSATSVSLYRGPLPEASMLAEYETIVPGCASKIVDNFTNEGDHRRAREKRGQYIALCALCAILLCAGGCAYLGMQLIGCTVAAFGLGGFFVTTRFVRFPPIFERS